MSNWPQSMNGRTVNELGTNTKAKSIFTLAQACLAGAGVDEKLTLTRLAKDLDAVGKLSFDGGEISPRPIASVQFPDRPAAVDPRHLPRRKLATPEGRAALLHAVAHIEFTAIQLAWDLLYRFRGLPETFCRDWLDVAADEALHFELLRGRLQELGYDYGDFPVHRGLWDVAEDTADDLAARLALVPRCMEARGLDVTPGMIAKLEQIGDEPAAAILRRILHDEVGHVALGSRWFHWVCRQRGVQPEETYFDLLRSRLRRDVRSPVNRELRLAAGFSASEIDRLESAERPRAAENADVQARGACSVRP